MLIFGVVVLMQYHHTKYYDTFPLSPREHMRKIYFSVKSDTEDYLTMNQ